MKQALKTLESYFELTQEPNEDGSVEANPEWDRGFQAAMAILRNAKQQTDYELGFDAGRNYGWNEAMEKMRLLRYAAEEAADPLEVEILTKTIKKMASKGVNNEAVAS